MKSSSDLTIFLKTPSVIISSIQERIQVSLPLKDLIALINHLEAKLMRDSEGVYHITDQEVLPPDSIDEKDQ